MSFYYLPNGYTLSTPQAPYQLTPISFPSIIYFSNQFSPFLDSNPPLEFRLPTEIPPNHLQSPDISLNHSLRSNIDEDITEKRRGRKRIMEK